jgi:hypothetical protein
MTSPINVAPIEVRFAQVFLSSSRFYKLRATLAVSRLKPGGSATVAGILDLVSIWLHSFSEGRKPISIYGVIPKPCVFHLQGEGSRAQRLSLLAFSECRK